MSDMVSLSENLVFPARAATIETIFDHLREQVPDHPEFQTLLAQ